MKLLLLSLLLVFIPEVSPKTVSYEKVATASAEDVVRYLNEAPIQFKSIPRLNRSVSVYRVVYSTDLVNHGNNLIPKANLSGLVIVPEDKNGPLETHAFLHEVLLKRDMVPSNSFETGVPDFTYGGYAISGALIAASLGDASVVPDYIGLGNSSNLPQMNAYMDAYTVATFALIEALKTMLSDLGDKQTLSGDLFTAGYGEGGFAALTVHQEAFEPRWESLELVGRACHAAGGYYDLGYSQFYESFEELKQEKDIDAADTAFLGYSYMIPLKTPHVFKSAYENGIKSILRGLFDGDKTYEEVSESLDTQYADFETYFNESVLSDAYNKTTLSEFGNALKSNTPINYLNASIGMERGLISICHGKNDLVSYIQNAEAVARALKDYPSESTRFFLLDEDECATHKACMDPCANVLVDFLADKKPNSSGNTGKQWYYQTEYLVPIGLGVILCLLLTIFMCRKYGCCCRDDKVYEEIDG
eukprot:m.337463 g.337463  ORF g.337463 m.337463 type:complete len:475 (-) comp18139_c0_seq1:52-1476(-)